ncbi:MAG: MarR family transcriptional regulator [Bacillota bacterium]|nr:MarR family transcriptional regulator [Bacillota bacterium]
MGASGDSPDSCDKGTPASHVDEVEMLLARIEHLMRTQGRAELADLGVTRDQFHALLALCGAELTMSELGERLGVSCSTVTDLVDRMERAGLAERIRDEGDRRVVRARITNAGKLVLNRVRARRRQYLGCVLGAMTEEEQSTLRDLLTRVHSLLASQSGP